MASELHRWDDGRFCYRVLSDYTLERGGKAGTTRVWAGYSPEHDKYLVREIARLAAALKEPDDAE